MNVEFLYSVKIIITALMAISMQSINAQTSLDSIGKEISILSDVVVNSQQLETKDKYGPGLQKAIGQYIETSGSFEHQINDPYWISIKSTDDGNLKIYTWEIPHKEGNIYYGYIQFKDGKSIALRDESQELEDIEYMELEPELWYGALYYHLISTQDEKGNPCYIAFGINRKNKFTTEKIAEVIYIENDQVKFGKSIFKNGEEFKNRIKLEYSAEANVTLNYNESMQLIIFDHLISRMGITPGQGPIQLPDGSYSGYKYENGLWIYQDKLYDQISETPPSDGRIRPKNGKDLFGRDKN